jgi:co-chaperonin GroES (HSP10)
MSEQMKVLNKFILIEKVVEQKQSKSGLILSGEEYQDMRYHYGTIFETGSNVSDMSKGDKVMYDKVHSYEVMIDSNRLTVVQEKDIVCVL